MNILIIPNSKKLRSGIRNPKEYPFDRLYPLLSQHTVEILTTEKSTEALLELLEWCDVWISVDTFFPHFVQNYGKKKGIVLWGKSDPAIFGYSNNINLLKDTKYLRKNQFDTWENEVWEDIFVEPQVVVDNLLEFSGK